MTDKQNVKTILNSDDPLSDNAIKFLISHREEDLFVDYKESFDEADEKQWIGITTDAMAFANTMGGFVLFGIKDSDFTIVGIEDHVTKILSNTNLILQKLNRYISPHFSLIRTKVFGMLSPDKNEPTHRRKVNPFNRKITQIDCFWKMDPPPSKYFA